RDLPRGRPAGYGRDAQPGGEERLLVQLSWRAHRPGPRQCPTILAGAPRLMPESGRRIAQNAGPGGRGRAAQTAGSGLSRGNRCQKGRLTGSARVALKKKPENKAFFAHFS